MNSLSQVEHVADFSGPIDSMHERKMHIVRGVDYTSGERLPTA